MNTPEITEAIVFNLQMAAYTNLIGTIFLFVLLIGCVVLFWKLITDE